VLDLISPSCQTGRKQQSDGAGTNNNEVLRTSSWGAMLLSMTEAVEDDNLGSDLVES
jgi:hypothetical protein